MVAAGPPGPREVKEEARRAPQEAVRGRSDRFRARTDAMSGPEQPGNDLGQFQCDFTKFDNNYVEIQGSGSNLDKIEKF